MRIFIYTEPHEDRLADNMIFGHESPVAAIGAVMAVVALHPIVIHLERIFLAYTYGLELVGVGYALVYPVVLLGDHHAVALARDIDRSVVVSRPVVVSERIDSAAVL